MKRFSYKFSLDTIAKIIIICILIVLSLKVIYQSQFLNRRPLWGRSASSNLAPFGKTQFSHALPLKGVRISEWRVINAGRGFAEKGFLSNGGLQDLHYGIISPDGKKEKFVKITYPPGPHWLAGIYTKICGTGNEGCYRIFPAILGIISLILIARILLSVLEPIKSAMMMLFLAMTSATTIIMHGLAYITYSSTLFLVQLALLLKIFKGNPKSNKKYIGILFIFGFIHGWLSADYLFVICLSPIPFALLYFQDTKEYRNRFLLVLLACSCGFLLAHFLHLIQVALYKGSILETYKFLYTQAWIEFDATGSKHPEDKLFYDSYSRWRLLNDYLRGYAGHNYFFGISATKFLAIIMSLLMIQTANITIQKPLQISLNRKSPLRSIFVILTAFVVSILWIVIMKAQSDGHNDYFTMHLFLLYFICVLTVLECMNININNTILQKQ